MPIYEYICFDCSHQFDVLRLMRDADSPIPCEKCQSHHTSRKLSLFYAHSDGRSLAGTSQAGCVGCSANSCAGCSN